MEVLSGHGLRALLFAAWAALVAACIFDQGGDPNAGRRTDLPGADGGSSLVPVDSGFDAPSIDAAFDASDASDASPEADAHDADAFGGG